MCAGACCRMPTKKEAKTAPAKGIKTSPAKDSKTAPAAAAVAATPPVFKCATCKQCQGAAKFDATQLKRARKGNVAHCRVCKQVASRKAKYGVTGDAYRVMLTKQNGRCDICKLPMGGKSKAIHVDHDHISQVVRGLLCVNCNTGLGQFYDNPLFLIQAALYLWASTPTARPKSAVDKERLRKLAADMAAATAAASNS